MTLRELINALLRECPDDPEKVEVCIGQPGKDAMHARCIATVVMCRDEDDGAPFIVVWSE